MMIHKVPDLRQKLFKSLSKFPRLVLTGISSLQEPLRDLREFPLRYAQVEDRQTSLQHIQDDLTQLSNAISGQLVQDKGQTKAVRFSIDGHDGLVCVDRVMRGTVLPILPAEQSEVGCAHLAEAEAIAELLYLALHRQAPEDLFDAMQLFDRADSLSNRVLVAYIGSSPRPIHELFDPQRMDLKSSYHMSLEPTLHIDCRLTQLQEFREQLIQWLPQMLTDDDKAFLLSVKRGSPEFDRLPFPNLAKLPAMKWKMMNVSKLHAEKQQRILEKLERIFSS